MSSALEVVARGTGNRVLDGLADGDLAGIDNDVQIVTLRAHESSLSAGKPMEFVHFPITAVLSTIVTLRGHSVEVGTIGNESFVEADAAFGATSASRSTICQVEGRVARMPLAAFALRMESTSFAALIRKNAGAALYCTQQYLACNASHSDAARCARWLLMTADRANRFEFVLSRQFLAIMLGLGEAAMREVIAELAAAGAIAYAEDHVTIRERTLLETLSCECYLACKIAFAESLTS